MDLLVKFILLFIVAQVARAQVISNGRCPSYQVDEEFEMRFYLGTWYEYARYPSRRAAINSCNTFFYTDGTGSQYGGLPLINIVQRGYNATRGEYTRLVGTMVAPEPTVQASMVVNIDGTPRQRAVNYNVLATDYDNVAIVYNCMQMASRKGELLVILTRERQPHQSVIDSAYATIVSQRLDVRRLVQSAQTNCPEVGPN